MCLGQTTFPGGSLLLHAHTNPSLCTPCSHCLECLALLSPIQVMFVFQGSFSRGQDPDKSMLHLFYVFQTPSAPLILAHLTLYHVLSWNLNRNLVPVCIFSQLGEGFWKTGAEITL